MCCLLGFAFLVCFCDSVCLFWRWFGGFSCLFALLITWTLILFNCLYYDTLRLDLAVCLWVCWCWFCVCLTELDADLFICLVLLFVFYARFWFGYALVALFVLVCVWCNIVLFAGLILLVIRLVDLLVLATVTFVWFAYASWICFEAWVLCCLLFRLLSDLFVRLLFSCLLVYFWFCLVFWLVIWLGVCWILLWWGL